jgi:hypothetical protein
MDEFSGYMQDSGEEIEAAIEEADAAGVLSSALFPRFRSRKQHTFGEKSCRPCASALAAMPREASPLIPTKAQRPAGPPPRVRTRLSSVQLCHVR